MEVRPGKSGVEGWSVVALTLPGCGGGARSLLVRLTNCSIILLYVSFILIVYFANIMRLYSYTCCRSIYIHRCHNS